MVQESVNGIAVGRFQMVNLEKGLLQNFEVATYLEGLLLHQIDCLQRKALEVLEYRTEVLGQWRYRSIFANKNPVTQTLATYRNQASASHIQTDKIFLVRDANEFAGQVVCPSVIPADKLAADGAGVVPHNRPTPVAAGIVESVELIILISNDQNR